MKAADIKEGGFYEARVSGNLVTVWVRAIEKVRMYWRNGKTKESTVYRVMNQKTGRYLTFRSAAKFRREMNQLVATVSDTVPASALGKSFVSREDGGSGPAKSSIEEKESRYWCDKCQKALGDANYCGNCGGWAST